jgi:hypothetical protein
MPKNLAFAETCDSPAALSACPSDFSLRRCLWCSPDARLASSFTVVRQE